MSAPASGRFLVTLVDFSVYRVVITAPTASAAQEEAERLWREDIEALTYKDGGIELVEAEALPEQEASS